MKEKRKYLEYFDGAFDSTVAEKIQPEKWPYVGYSKTDGVVYTIIPEKDGYNLITLKKVDISNITYEEVDLGLSSELKWANKNVGANSENDYGAYFSWGNTDGYTVSGTKFLTVDEVCQLFSSVTGETVTTKEELENMLSEMGISIDNIGTSDYSFDDTNYRSTTGANITSDITSENDAATFNCDSEWRMPTIGEYKELVNAVKSSDGTKGTLTCQYEYIDLNGEQQSLVVYNDDAGNGYFSVGELYVDDSPIFKTILGIRFTNDDTGASVYFPACGCVGGSILAYIGFYGNYWSSSIDDTTNARNFDFYPYNVYATNSNGRYFGLCVRAVK